MSMIRPFRAVRPQKALAASVAALPYDVYNTEEARKITAEEPLSFLRIDRAETQLPEGTDPYSDIVYRKAREILDRMLSDGSFIQEEKACFYIYALTMNGRTQNGIVGCASVDDYINQVILKHENTLEAKELDRIRHVEACSAQTGPIFLTYRPHAGLKQLTASAKEKPCHYDFTSSDGERHQVWRIDEKSEIGKISQIFAGIPHLYIADGHHRAASAVKVGLRKRALDPGFSGDEEYNYFLSVLFPSDELHIYDYNRCVLDMNGYTAGTFLDKIKDRFDIAPMGETAYRPEKKGEFGLYCSGSWYRLQVRDCPSGTDPVECLDVSVLQDYILDPILGIRNPKADPRIRFVGGIRGLEALREMADRSGGIAFSMYPTSMEELLAVADAGRLMPPKSTWFEPKLRSGLFIHRF